MLTLNQDPQICLTELGKAIDDELHYFLPYLESLTKSVDKKNTKNIQNLSNFHFLLILEHTINAGLSSFLFLFIVIVLFEANV